MQQMRGQGLDTAPFFEANSVALIGASEREGSLGTVVLRNLAGSGFAGEIYPVNPNYRKVQGQRCYASVGDVDAPVDLAVIVTPAATVPDLLEACGASGIRAAVILSAGFRETGEAGRELERRVLDVARERRLERMDGLVLRENRGMLALAGDLGFEQHAVPEDPALVRISLDL